MRYTVILEEGREQGFVALCPALPRCVSQGRTRPEALANIREAMEVYIEALLEDGEQVILEPVQKTEWPSDFWQAFEGVPDGFERPAQVPQQRPKDDL